MKIEQLNELAENSGFSKIGIRVMTGGEIAQIGETLKPSYVWIDGEQTEELLEGVSAIDAAFDGWELSGIERAMNLIKAYDSENLQVVMIGTSAESYEGNDVGEVVMTDAQVIAIL